MNLQALTSIQPGGATTPTPTRMASLPGLVPTETIAMAVTSPSAIVSLGGTDDAASDALATYALPRPALTWDAAPVDAISTSMARNLTATRAAGNLRGLGAALLTRLATDGSDFAQAVQSTGSVASAGTADAGLSITTASGHTITLAFHAADGGVSVKLAGAGGLSDAERSALGKLATDFQAALDGMTTTPPTIDLGGLATLDGKLFTSISVTARTTPPGGVTQSISFQANTRSRSITVDSPAGKIDISTDLTNPAAWGTQAQRDEAIRQYLGQFDKAASRGHGDPSTMDLFKDAFRQVNSGYGATPAGTLSTRSGWLSQGDHAALSGLADFTASLTQAAVASNPFRSDELDAFAYQVNQSTRISGDDAINRGIHQEASSSLHASFHAALSPGTALALTMLPSSQNYYYTRIDDTAQSGVDIRYARGRLVDADVQRSARQSTQQARYVMAKLVEETSLPARQSQARDLVGLLTPLDKQRVVTARDQAARDVALAALHSSLGLESDPTLLA